MLYKQLMSLIVIFFVAGSTSSTFAMVGYDDDRPLVKKGRPPNKAAIANLRKLASVSVPQKVSVPLHPPQSFEIEVEKPLVKQGKKPDHEKIKKLYNHKYRLNLPPGLKYNKDLDVWESEGNTPEDEERPEAGEAYGSKRSKSWALIHQYEDSSDELVVEIE